MTNTPTKKIKYSPWLSISYVTWKSSIGNSWICVDGLSNWFNIPNRRGIQIRVIVSPVSQGEDYQCTEKYNWLALNSSHGVEYVNVYSSLYDLVYEGCWIGLEMRENAIGDRLVVRKSN